MSIKPKIRKQPAADANASTGNIPFDEAVREARAIIKELETTAARVQWRLGELADNVEKTKYGDRTQAKFAAEIGVAPCTLKRYRTVYRDWKSAAISAPGRFSIPSYSVLRELQTHPDRAEIIQTNPNITKGEAHKLMLKLKGAEEEQQQEEQENDWSKDNRRWLRELYNDMRDVSRRAGVALNLPPEKQHELLQGMEPLMLMDMGGYARIQVDFVDHFEARLEEEEAKEAAAKEARAKGAGLKGAGAKEAGLTPAALAEKEPGGDDPNGG
jgi:hypothetical protein